MSLTAISSLESAKEKFFMNSTSCLESRNQTFLGSGGQNESNSHQLARIGERKIFHELEVHHAYKVAIKRFLAQEAKMSSGGRNESNSHQVAGIGKKKIFHELDIHHV